MIGYLKDALLDQPNEAFRVSFTRYFTAVMAYGTTMSIVSLAAIGKLHGDIGSHLVSLVYAALVALIPTGAAVAYFKVYVNPNGIRGYNALGLYHNLQWSEIDVVYLFKMPGLRHVLLCSKATSRVMWVPLFLSDINRFKELVNQHTQPDNPLNRFFASVHDP